MTPFRSTLCAAPLLAGPALPQAPDARPAGDDRRRHDHIVVARGRDYGDVAPVKGVLHIAGAQKTEHAVDVVPVPA